MLTEVVDFPNETDVNHVVPHKAVNLSGSVIALYLRYHVRWPQVIVLPLRKVDYEILFQTISKVAGKSCGSASMIYNVVKTLYMKET